MENLNRVDTSESNEAEQLPAIVNNKKPIITFSKLNKYFIIPFICPVFYVISNIFMDLIVKAKVINKKEFFDSICIGLNFFLVGLFYFIPYFNINYNKKNDTNSDIQTTKSGIKYIYNAGIIGKNNSWKIIILIISLSLIIIITFVFYIFINEQNNVFEENIYYLFFIPLFSKILLKENIYKHQYFSLIISIIGIIFLVIPVCFKLNTNDILPNILTIINGILTSLFLVIIKYISEKYYISPLKISLLVGIIALLMNIIGYNIYSLISFNNLSYFEDFFYFSEDVNKFVISIYIILYILFKILQKLLILLVLFYFSPTLIIITNMIEPFLSWIINTIKDGGHMPDNVLNPIGFLIILFSSLIYNEIIIFNFCGLNENTKKFVNQRLNSELEEIKFIVDDLLSDNVN